MTISVFVSLALGAMLKYVGRPVPGRPHNVRPADWTVVCARVGNALLLAGGLGLVALYAL